MYAAEKTIEELGSFSLNDNILDVFYDDTIVNARDSIDFSNDFSTSVLATQY